MCGIIGYVGERNAIDILLKGLKRLEYRGYDSCGFAVVSNKGELYLERIKGRVDELFKKVEGKNYLSSHGIAHTRWATHGIPNEENAHPHTDCNNEIVIVHNGIIENYLELREKLKNHRFRSETDTEVVVHLLEENLKLLLKNVPLTRHDVLHPVFFKAFLNTVKTLKGSFAICVVWKKLNGVILGARRFSPLVIGVGEGENFISSDVSGFIEHTKKVYFMDDDEVVFMDKNVVSFFDFDGKKKDKKIETVNWDIKMAERGGYKHFMLKEIYEQDIGFESTIARRVLPVGEYLSGKEINLTKEEIRNFSSIEFVACGTAYHAAYVGKYVFESFSINANITLASEFSYRVKAIDKKALVVAVSQSGETADTIESVRLARKNGNKILSITNTLGSTITRESDYVIYTHCGPEIAVASTKAFTSQLAAIYVFAINFAYLRGNILITKARELSNELLEIPKLIKKAFSTSSIIEETIKELRDKNDYLYIARGINYPIALEGALKLKEISYLHAEGYAGGEMKHGPIAIIDEGMPVIAICVSDREFEFMRSNIEEVRARGGRVIGIVDEESKNKVKLFRYFEVPKVNEIFTPVLTVIPLQLFAYYTALDRNRDIDKPRNLAKSVTVK
jgi:glucosamine--fructose-6-phosphate aminotransferase (isomerizing)